MTYQINIFDYLEPADRLPAMYNDYRNGARGERWNTARQALLAAPVVTEDPAGHAAAAEAATEFLGLDLALAHARLIGQVVSWQARSRKKGERSASKQYSGTVFACVAKGADASELLPADVLELKGKAKQARLKLPLKAKANRYIMTQAGPDGPIYLAAPALRINRANMAKLMVVPATEKEPSAEPSPEKAVCHDCDIAFPTEQVGPVIFFQRAYKRGWTYFTEVELTTSLCAFCRRYRVLDFIAGRLPKELIKQERVIKAKGKLRECGSLTYAEQHELEKTMPLTPSQLASAIDVDDEAEEPAEAADAAPPVPEPAAPDAEPEPITIVIDRPADPPEISDHALSLAILQGLARGRMFASSIGSYVRSAYPGFKHVSSEQLLRVITHLQATGQILKSESLPTTYSLANGPQEMQKPKRTRKPKAKKEPAAPAEPPIPCAICQAMGMEPSEAMYRVFESGIPTWICEARGGQHVARQQPNGSLSWAGHATGLPPGWSRLPLPSRAWQLPDGSRRLYDLTLPAEPAMVVPDVCSEQTSPEVATETPEVATETPEVAIQSCDLSMKPSEVASQEAEVAMQSEHSGPCLYTGCSGTYQQDGPYRWSCDANSKHQAWISKPGVLAYRSIYGMTSILLADWLAGRAQQLQPDQQAEKPARKARAKKTEPAETDLTLPDETPAVSESQTYPHTDCVNVDKSEKRADGASCRFCGEPMEKIPGHRLWHCSSGKVHRFWVKNKQGVWMGPTATDEGNGVVPLPSWAK
jgi:hypothetical protein